MHPRPHDLAEFPRSAHRHDPRKHVVDRARQPFQHPDRVGLVGRLGEDLAAGDDGRIGGEDDGAGFRVPVRDGPGLVARDPQHVDLRGFAGTLGFVHVGRVDRELKPGAGEQFRAARRRRRENQGAVGTNQACETAP